MNRYIYTSLEIIKQSIAWADKYGKDSFPREVFKNYRRKLKRFGEALSENCSAAAYGESQVGKSYLISSLLSTPEAPFVIENEGVEYSFIDDINPSGGNNIQQESTGVITRFTIRQSNSKMKDYVKITNLSVVDIILLLADSYYNDVKINTDSVMLNTEIDNLLCQMDGLWSSNSAQDIITEDDIRDICDYLKDIIGNNAANICKSNFCKIIAPVINYVASDNWVNIFGLIWNNNPELNRLFSSLVNEYKKLNFSTEVYVPFDAVLRDKGTLLKIDWLDSVCGIHRETKEDELYTDVYNREGELIAKDFSKAYLSALIGELTFVLPEQIANERKFLKKIDLLDFPGARSREKIKERQIGEVLPTILRRGKVAYLFNKYSCSLKISSVLFCHHNHQKTEPTIGSSIHNWIVDNIGESPEIRAGVLSRTNGIAPLFLICTKFNNDLERSKNDMPETASKLDNHWARFNTTIPKIIEPEKWFEEWVSLGGVFSSPCFQNVYLLRDFYWSSKNQVFDGYNEQRGTVESRVHTFDEYPNYFDDLRNSFLVNPFVKKHFANPQQAWDDVATINNDGSKAIIRNLDAIAEVLDDARSEQYRRQLVEMRDEVTSVLSVYRESDNKEENNARTRQIIGDIKLRTEFAFGEKPERFGRIIDGLMVSSTNLRTIAYDILVRHIEEPQCVSSIKMIRATSGIDINEDRAINVQKLCKRYNKEENELKSFFAEMGVTLEDVVSDESELLSTVPDVIVKHIIEYWNNHINEQVKNMGNILPHADEIAFMLLTLLNKLGVKKAISDKINWYYGVFERSGLPNVIADYASLTLNNFVSTVGREYMSDKDMINVAKKAQSCGLEIDQSSISLNSNVSQQPLLEVLTALEQSKDEMNNSRIDLSTLKKLPFWDSYQRWENFITIGLLYVSEISHVDFVANEAIKKIIDANSNLYIN
ncbi:MAG: virulence factor SrfC family protein [Paludibacteraceae bacterium]|nr:virulence factor SrfC family protein [Paludibacteraceae bacterium]